MIPWTSISSWQAPGRPHRRQFEESSELTISPDSSNEKGSPTMNRMHLISLKRCRMCSNTRMLFRVYLLILVAVSSVSSAPLLPSPINSAHQQGTHSREADLISSSSSLSSSVEQLSHSLGRRHSSVEEEEEDQSLVREERALRSNGIWPNATIPFSFDTSSLSLVQRNRIIKAMKIWQKKTCVRFIERTRETYFVNIFRNDAACQSDVGYRPFRVYRGRGQPMQLSQTYCLTSKHRGKIVHELGHVIGFYHEHQRPDRNKYVEILWDNLIDSEYIRNDYEIVSSAHAVGTKYDYKSIMHYGPRDNSANGNATMIIKDARYQNAVGQRTKPTATDYRQVNLFYRCSGDAIDMEQSLQRPDLLPSSANDIRSGDSITLTPEVNSNKTWWLNCTDECEISDRAGKKFNSDDVTGCSELIFEMHKINDGSEVHYIKVGDAVVLKQRSAMGVNIVSCSYQDKQCRAKESCVLGDGGSFDEDLMCPEDAFVVGAMGKVEGEQITHRDRLTFSSPAAHATDLGTSRFQCKINEGGMNGQCYILSCPANSIGDSSLELAESESLDPECNQPSTFIVTKL